MIRHARTLADILTLFRALLGPVIAWTGFIRGAEGLSIVCAMVLVSWLSDLLDGPLARRDNDHGQTWIGRHDAEADLSISIGVALYLLWANYVAIWPVLGILILLVVLWMIHSHQLAWPLYALPYVILIGVALEKSPPWGWVLVGYLIGVLILRRRRLADQYLAEFFAALKSLRRL